MICIPFHPIFGSCFFKKCHNTSFTCGVFITFDGKRTVTSRGLDVSSTGNGKNMAFTGTDMLRELLVKDFLGKIQFDELAIVNMYFLQPNKERVDDISIISAWCDLKILLL
jgi:hypothetical protein